MKRSRFREYDGCLGPVLAVGPNECSIPLPISNIKHKKAK